MATQDQISTMSDDIGSLRREWTKMSTDIAGLTAVVRQSVQSQHQINGKLDRMMDDHELRLREVEKFKIDLAARLPVRLLSAENIEKHLQQQDMNIEKHLQQQDLRISEQSGKIDGINKTLAKWGGVFVAVSAIIQAVVPFISKLFFGGGS